MVIFKKISYSNFLSTGSSPNVIYLNQEKKTLIIGENGAGKSTILDALCFGLFGKAFRSINKDQLINSVNGNKALVEVEFSVGKKEYKVTRGIKPNIFKIYKDGVLIDQDSSSINYQSILERILSMNYKTFTHVVILGMASFIPFMNLTPAQRRDIVEDILDIKIFSVMSSLAKENLSRTKGDILSLDSKITSQERIIDNQHNIISVLSQDNKDRIDNLNKKIESAMNDIDANNGLISQSQGKIKEYDSKLKFEDEVKNKINSYTRDINNLKNDNSRLEHLERYFEGNNSCSTCQQSIDEDFRQKKINEYKDLIKAGNVKIDSITHDSKKYLNIMDTIRSIRGKWNEENINLSNYRNSIKMLTRNINEYKADIDKLDSNDDNIKNEENKLNTLKSDLIELNNNKRDLLARRDMEEVALNMLKDTGVKTSIINKYLPILNNAINMYLDKLDADIRFDIDSKFNETIKSRFRDNFSYSSFSQGERQRIDISILMTWRFMARLKNSVSTNLMILDEVFDSSLDDSGTDYFFSMLNDLEDNTNTFIISHNKDMVEKFNSVIKFKKINNYSVMDNDS